MRKERIPRHINTVVGAEGTKSYDFSIYGGLDLKTRMKRAEANARREIKEKNEEDVELFDIAVKHVARFVERYGGKVKEYPDEIFFKTTATKDESEKGLFHLWTGDVFVSEDKKIPFLATLIHELLHYASYQTVHIAQEAGKESSIASYRLRRSGLAIFSDKKAGRGYFEDIDEGVIEASVQRIMQEIMRESPVGEMCADSERVKEVLREYTREYSYTKEHQELIVDEILFIEDAEKIVNWLDSQEKELQKKQGTEIYAQERRKMLEAFSNMVEGFSVEGKVHDYHRWSERRFLSEQIEKVFTASREKFNTKEQVFELFARAVFSGRMLPLARIVENALGKGSLRTIGENIPQKIHEEIPEDDD